MPIIPGKLLDKVCFAMGVSKPSAYNVIREGFLDRFLVRKDGEVSWWRGTPESDSEILRTIWKHRHHHQKGCAEHYSDEADRVWRAKEELRPILDAYFKSHKVS